VSNNDRPNPNGAKGITRLAVSGFKSIRNEINIEIRPLTILAGANSSGKSSIIQPLLMMKQTLEVPYDPGALLLDGPNVRFTMAEQFLCKEEKTTYQDLVIGLEVDGSFLLENTFRLKKTKREMQIVQAVYDQERMVIRPRMSEREIKAHLSEVGRELSGEIQKRSQQKFRWRVRRSRCFLSLELYSDDFPGGINFDLGPTTPFEYHVSKIIHVPGLRGNPERTYRVTSVTGPEFHGTFEHYVASVVSRWQANKSKALDNLGNTLETLGLTWKVSSQRIDDTQVELSVGRLHHRPAGEKQELVSIADVGFGVSQVLPVLVALLVARKGQLLYIEQPELHLHPKAQVALAQVLAEAAQRGVRVVAETHSALLLLGIQTLVAQGQLDPNLVKLHWFTLDEDGCTTVTSRDLDETGAYGDWPEDFGDVELKAQSDYLDAVEEREVSV
jgi:predicted ATPase